jgi:prepilin-type N-terminal cleavage/methylation domain-containing protein
MNCRGLTLMEMLVATALGSLLAGIIFTLGSFGQRSFALMANDSDLDLKSRNALRVLSDEVHQANAVTAFTSNAELTSLSLTNSREATLVTISWSPTDRKLILKESGAENHTDKVLLTACDRWDVGLYNRAPTIRSAGVQLNPATSLPDCKIVSMAWSCSTNALKTKAASSLSTQIALRNKVD